MQTTNNTRPKNKSKRVQKHFTEKEDQIIKHFVQIIGSKKWSFIANFVPGRTAKQCRDRYMNNLKPEIEKVEWSQNEDNLLIDLYTKYGPKWSLFCKYFGKRNQVSIKNRLAFLQRSRFFFPKKKQEEQPKNDKEEPNRSQKRNSDNQLKTKKGQTFFEKDDIWINNEKYDQFFEENSLFDFDDEYNI